MSMVVTRSPLIAIGMNAGGTAPKRRSARLSLEGQEENEPPSKKAKVNAAQNAGPSAAEGANAKKGRRKVYDQESDDFVFRKSKRARTTKETAIRNPATEEAAPAGPATTKTSAPAKTPKPIPAPAPVEDPAPQTALKKRRKLPTTPERENPIKTIRRSKRISNEHESSPHRPAHAKSHAKQHRSPSPDSRPTTVGKTRKKQANGETEEEEKTMLIALPFADTPIIKRNKEMRKGGGDQSRRSSTGMRGRRASSLIDEGRGNALPHAEVPTAEFFKHISADLTEPRRMRCLIGWCGSRALPPKPDPPKTSSKDANAEFQALQAARIIQEELSQDLVSKGSLSDWFSRDEEVQPQVVLRKKPNPRNVTNAAKAEELERELERLKKERQEWDTLMASAVPAPTPAKNPTDQSPSGPTRGLSPVHSDLLDSPDRAILSQFRDPAPSAPGSLQQRLQNISANLEFSIDQFAHGVHAMATTRDTAERVADRSLKDAAEVLEEREKERRERGGGVQAMDALRGLARVLNRGR